MRARLDDEIMHAEIARGLFGEHVGVAPMIGRFVVLGTLGAGGMGRVHRAIDPELDRRIALKVLHPDARGGHDATLRLRREAVALAKLSHPNVVTVHEVGTCGDEVFVAMEHVEGGDLRAWMLQHPVGSSDRRAAALTLLIQAARGLAAAHSAGLVHRDFKPSNVLVGSDGRVRVADFGLARAVRGSSDQELPPTDSDHDAGAAITAFGTVVGTPRYMSPEQRRGAELDAASDQFSFCITAWEVLFGEHPWQGSPPAEATPSTPPSGAPKLLVAALRRGLAAEPSQRFPSMDPLIAALLRARHPDRRRRTWLAGGVLMLSLAAGMGALQLQERRDLEQCRDGSALTEAWTDRDKDAMREGLLATEVGHAATTADKLQSRLDDYVDEWLSVRDRVCRATRVDGWRDELLLATAIECLDEGQRAFVDLTGALASTPTPAQVDHAIQAALRLPVPAACDDEQSLRRRPGSPSDADTLAAIEQVDTLLGEADTLENLGEYARAHALVEQAREAAAGIGWPPLHARLAMRTGEVAASQGDYEQAVASFEGAGFLAAAAGDVELAVAAQTLRMATLTADLERYEEAARVGAVVEDVLLGHGMEGTFRQASLWRIQCALALDTDSIPAGRDPCEAGLALAERLLGSTHPELDVFLMTIGRIEHARGDYKAARKSFVRALELEVAAFGEDHPITADAIHNLGVLAYLEGDYAAARRDLAHGLAIHERAFGSDHPGTARSLDAIGVLQRKTGDLAEAAKSFERALQIQEATFGRDRLPTVPALSNVAAISKELGDLARAEELYRRALAINERALGPDHRQLAGQWANLGIIALERGDNDKAIEYAQRALRIWETSLGASHPDLAYALNTLGTAERKRGDPTAALAYYERALEVRTKALGSDHGDLAPALQGIGLARLELRQYSEALPVLQRAVALREANLAPEHPELAHSQFALARAGFAVGDREPAIALARTAERSFAKAVPAQAESLATVRAWLAEH